MKRGRAEKLNVLYRLLPFRMSKLIDFQNAGSQEPKPRPFQDGRRIISKCLIGSKVYTNGFRRNAQKSRTLPAMRCLTPGWMNAWMRGWKNRFGKRLSLIPVSLRLIGRRYLHICCSVVCPFSLCILCMELLNTSPGQYLPCWHNMLNSLFVVKTLPKTRCINHLHIHLSIRIEGVLSPVLMSFAI
jgi:hypothetical protein